MEEDADARDRRMRLSATTFHFNPMRHADDGPPAFSAESAAAAAAVRSISEREAGSLTSLHYCRYQLSLHISEYMLSDGKLEWLGTHRYTTA